MEQSDQPLNVGSMEGLGVMGSQHHDATSYWFGVGHAPNFSRTVAQANADWKRAEENLLKAMQHAYPLGDDVTVIHNRGRFRGVVMGWDTHGVRIRVRNTTSGKESKWWAAHVQLAAYDA